MINTSEYDHHMDFIQDWVDASNGGQPSRGLPPRSMLDMTFGRHRVIEIIHTHLGEYAIQLSEGRAPDTGAFRAGVRTLLSSVRRSTAEVINHLAIPEVCHYVGGRAHLTTIHTQMVWDALRLPMPERPGPPVPRNYFLGSPAITLPYETVESGLQAARVICDLDHLYLFDPGRLVLKYGASDGEPEPVQGLGLHGLFAAMILRSHFGPDWLDQIGTKAAKRRVHPVIEEYYMSSLDNYAV